jgi:hypothetical protein
MVKMTVQDGPVPAQACNIGPAEISRRRRGAYALFAAGIVIALALVAIEADPLLRLGLALPFGAGMVTWLQARRRLCVGFAVAGIRNLGGRGDAERVTDAEILRTDRAAAMRVVRDGSLIGVAIAVVFALLPI